MFQLERFVAADAEFDALAAEYMKVDGVTGVAVAEAPDTDRKNPGGPQFLVFYDKIDEVARLRREGKLLETVKTAYDEVEVVLARGTSRFTDAHTGDADPMKPGDSVSGQFRDKGPGSLGAVVDSPGNGDHFITCGHVASQNPGGQGVYQSGMKDALRQNRQPRLVGQIVNNALEAFKNDSACVRVDSQYRLNRSPYDSPAPSPTHPAIGMQAAISNGNGKLFFIDIIPALADCGASMSNVIQMSASDKGRKIRASGRTSGLIEAIIDGRATTRPDGCPIALSGFYADRVRGGDFGDSGAVAVVMPSGPTVTVTDLSGTAEVTGTDVDDAAEYLPGTIPELDQLIAGDGSNIAASGTSLSAEDGRNLLSRLVARLRRLGELDLVVHATSFRNCCAGDAPPTTRPTPVREIILKPGERAELPDIMEGMPEEVTSQSTCCTFGARPVVTISGEDSIDIAFNLEVTLTASIRVSFKITQTVLSASFLRYGACYRNKCDCEVLRGTVTLSRSILFEIEGSLGSVELPVIGKIEAGKGGFRRQTTTSVIKSFELSCQPG